MPGCRSPARNSWPPPTPRSESPKVRSPGMSYGSSRETPAGLPISAYQFQATIIGRARRSVRAVFDVRASGGQRTARPTEICSGYHWRVLSPGVPDLPAIFLILSVAANTLSSQMHPLFKLGYLRLYGSWTRVAVSLVFLALCQAASVARAQTSPTNQWLIAVGLTDSSPAVGVDGTIYLGTVHQKLWAVAPNGVPRWQFQTGSKIKSSPAIGADGTISFGCRDRKFYAVSPD